MKYKIYNNTEKNIEFENMAQDLIGFAQKRFKFKKPPTIHFDSDSVNATKTLGKTAYYNPENFEIHVFVDNRHPKDILRSIAHEIVHHVQNEQGSLSTNGYTGEGYAQKNAHLRKMEEQAYKEGNLCFRDWEDSYKSTNYIERSETMSLKEWKNKELSQILINKWGFKMNLDNLHEEKKPDEDGDGVPDWADKHPGEDDAEKAEDDTEESDKPEEGK